MRIISRPLAYKELLESETVSNSIRRFGRLAYSLARRYKADANVLLVTAAYPLGDPAATELIVAHLSKNPPKDIPELFGGVPVRPALAQAYIDMTDAPSQTMQ